MRLRPIVQNRRARRFVAGRLARLRRVAAGAALALALTGGQAARAGDMPEPPREKPEEIEVLGKTPESPYKMQDISIGKYTGNLQNTPQLITTVPQRLIEVQGATTLRDTLRNVTGIGISAGEGGAQGDDFTLRGYSAKGDIFIDGVRDQGSYFRDSFNLQSVEVAKGPSSSYFGRGSTGGLVNQVSKTPQLAAAYSGILSAGNGSFGRATADLNQPLSATSAVRLNLVVQDSEVVDRDEVETQRLGFAPSIAFGIGTPTQITLSYLYQEEDNLPDYGLPYVEGKPARVDRDTFFGLEDEDFEQTNVSVGTFKVDHTFSDSFQLHNTTRYSYVNREAAPTAPRPCSPGEANCRGAQAFGIRRSRPERDAQETILSNQTDLNLEFQTGGISHALGTGVELARETFGIIRYADDGPFSVGFDPDAIDPNVARRPRTRSQRSHTTALSFGAYAADQIQLNAYFDVVLGLRWDYFGARFEDEFSTGPGTTRPDFDRKDRKFSYRAGLVFHPTAAQSYYVSYGTSFNPSAESIASLTGNNASTKPEENESFEIGGKFELLDGGLNVQTALFQIDKTDARETDPVSGLQVLDGSRSVRGFEVGIAGSILPGWNVFGGYTFLDSENTDAVDPLAEGKDVQRVPRHSATFWNSYKTGKLEIGGGPSYVSHRFANATNTNSVDGYVRWDAAISYDVSEQVQVRLNVQNLGDKEYFEGAGGGHAIPGPGRTFIVSTSFNF
jgi:catecholate siderophore receptor